VFTSHRHLLSTHQAQLVMTFANVAAIAMENARLFEQTREGLKVKETLLREMHHRVKNNLQQVGSILNMEKRRVKSPEAEQVLQENVARIHGIAATHDLLTTTVQIQARVDELARRIVSNVQGNLVSPALKLKTNIGTIPIMLSGDQATTFGIVL